MARDARLRLAQDVGQVGDGQFGFGQQRQHAQARFLARRLEGHVEGIEAEPCTGAHSGLTTVMLAHDLFRKPVPTFRDHALWAASHYIKISLYVEPAFGKGHARLPEASLPRQMQAGSLFPLGGGLGGGGVCRWIGSLCWW